MVAGVPQVVTRRLDPRAAASLNAAPRCAQTGNLRAGQCAGHWDYFGTFMVWTRHTRLAPTVRYRLIRYDQIGPERIAVRVP